MGSSLDEGEKGDEGGEKEREVGTGRDSSLNTRFFLSLNISLL
jgi:hypothetical protein